MITVLSTRNLTEEQKSRLESAGIGLETHDAIQINFLKTSIPQGFENFIFTSKNGVKGFLYNLDRDLSELADARCYCVGEKTSELLAENGLFVSKTARNAKEIGDFVAKTGEDDKFLILTGNRNRPELRNTLTANKISFREVQVYKTALNPVKFEKEFDYILFFSPSGVESFAAVNPESKALALCIGETTAREARKYFSRVMVAGKQTTDAVLDTLIEINPKPINP